MGGRIASICLLTTRDLYSHRLALVRCLSEAHLQLVLIPGMEVTILSTVYVLSLFPLFLETIGQSHAQAQVTLSANQEHLACTTNDGGVYVLEISTGVLTRMKINHSSVSDLFSFESASPCLMVTWNR